MDCHDIVELAPLYLSGELDAPRAAAFAAHLRECPACALEISQEIEFDAHLREGALMGGVETGALELRIRERISAEPRNKKARWAIAAAGVAALLIAGLAVRMWPTQEPVRACSDAARDHRYEIVLKHARTWTRDQSGIAALAARLSLATSAIPTFASAGYHLERAKLCRLDGRVFLHLVYTNGAAEFSFYIRPEDRPQSHDIYTAGVEHEHVALVESKNLTALVVTDQPGDLALTLARSITATL